MSMVQDWLEGQNDDDDDDEKEKEKKSVDQSILDLQTCGLCCQNTIEICTPARVRTLLLLLLYNHNHNHTQPHTLAPSQLQPQQHDPRLSPLTDE